MIHKPICGAYPDALFCKQHGIVGRWLFNERGSKIIDVCRNFNTGAISGAAWVGSKMGGGLRFDGSDDYANIGRTHQRYIDYNKAFTISFHFTFNTYSSTTHHCFAGQIRHKGSGTYDDLTIRINPSDQIEFWLFSSPVNATQDGYTYISSAISVVTGKPYHLVCTYNGGNTTTSGNIYLDGKSIYSSTTDYSAITQSIYQTGLLLEQDLWIGRRNWTTPDMPFPGIIDQVIIANRAWTLDEISKFNKNPWCGLISSTQFTSEYSQMAALGAD